MTSDRTLRKWYRFINRRFFHGELPDNVIVRWADTAEETEAQWEERYFGWTDDQKSAPWIAPHPFQIVLSRPRNVYAATRFSTLAHEMIHVATRCRDDHGPAFERWRERIADAGIFRKGAIRKGLTIF